MERRRYGQTSVDLRRVAGLQQVVAEQHATHRVSDGQHHAALEAAAHCRHYLRCMHLLPVQIYVSRIYVALKKQLTTKLKPA